MTRPLKHTGNFPQQEARTNNTGTYSSATAIHTHGYTLIQYTENPHSQEMHKIQKT